MSNFDRIKKIVDVLSELGKQKDTAQVLRDLDEVEKSVMYVRKIVLRRINVARNVKAVEHKQIVETANEKIVFAALDDLAKNGE